MYYEPIVLASASPRRKRMFVDMGLNFEVVPANIDEDQRGDEAPSSFVRRVAEQKGESVARKLESEGRRPFVVAADTVVVIDDEVLCKPRSAREAREMLQRLSGRTHTVITGWCVGRVDELWQVNHGETAVTFYELSPAQIDGYVQTGEGMDKAGAYAIQKIGAFLVDRIDGNYFNVVGLPLSDVVRALEARGAIPVFPVS